MDGPSSSQIRHYLSESDVESSSDDSVASAGPESDIDQAQLDAPPIVNVVAPVDIEDEDTDDQEADQVISDPIWSLRTAVSLCILGREVNLEEKGHASKVVKYLMRGMLGVGHSLYMDNYYISYPLATELLSEKTYCTGTMRSDRKHVPLDLKTARLARGEKAERYANGVLIAKWCDKRQVLYLSTEFENDWAISMNRYNQPRQKPLPIIQYNAHMKGVDRNDQLMSYYAFEHKSIRWYKKIFVHFLQTLLVNSFKLYLQTNPRKRSLYHFRLSIINMLLPAANAITPPLRPRQQTTVRHVLSKMDTPDNTGERMKRKRCRECSKTKKRTMTLFFCAQCPGEPGLCALRCFDKYHE
ncbi:piggyBac transposable element-derived protein 4-like [Homalodisca vitripennis]|uniref:piggyBac transposable element-derived protein 4-like n=1 Tax=Homalodisca vitripennis TaxID=197043 RepID=UPI001EEA4360|nr:piggyBac transposable element-derived protein 4-like [Homalodisca vitripennis]